VDFVVQLVKKIKRLKVVIELFYGKPISELQSVTAVTCRMGSLLHV